MRVLGLSVQISKTLYDVEARSSLIVYTKFERVSLNDRQTDGCIAGICASLHIPYLFDIVISIKIRAAT